MAYPQWLSSNGEITPDGRKVITFIEAQFTQAEVMNDINTLNSMSGDVKHYYIAYYKLEGRGQDALIEGARGKFLRDCGKSIAQRVWDNLTYFEKQARESEQVTENAEATTEIAAALEQLREELARKISALEKKAKADAKKIRALEAEAAKGDSAADEGGEPDDDSANDNEETEGDEAE